MAVSTTHILLFISTLTLAASSSAAFENSSTITEHSYANVHIKMMMENNTAPVFLDCMVAGQNIFQGEELHGGDMLSIKITHKGVYTCGADWTRYGAEFEAFSPAKHKHGLHSTLFWVISEEGVLMSWNNIDFTFEAHWLLRR